MNKIVRYFNTVKYLKATQIFNQIKLKANKCEKNQNHILFERLQINKNVKLYIESLDSNISYLSRFDVDTLMDDRINLLHEERIFNNSVWQTKDASPLWNYNLQYFEYCISLANKYKQTNDVKYCEKFKKIYKNWFDTYFKVQLWQSYTISLRIPNLLICIELFGVALDEEFLKNIYSNMYDQYQFLINNLELHLLGNHYFENLKTIIICSILFGEDYVYQKFVKKILREIDIEVLADGVHFELSIMYHKIVLEDIIRVTLCMKNANRKEYLILIPIIQKMTNALASLENGTGRTPLFNDAGDNIAKSKEQLLKAALSEFGIKPILQEQFVTSGYYKLYDENITVIMDVGKIGPDYMPGHGHCDALSYELFLEGNPLFVNSGTYQYQGNLREYFRRTSAHNTVIIDQKEQSECWAEHRVARRISKISSHREGNIIVGKYSNYVGSTHQREICLENRVLKVTDRIKCKKICKVKSFLHISPEYSVKAAKDLVIVEKDKNQVCLIRPNNCDYLIHTDGVITNYSPEFGLLLHSTVIEFQWDSTTSESGYSIQIK